MAKICFQIAPDIEFKLELGVDVLDFVPGASLPREFIVGHLAAASITVNPRGSRQSCRAERPGVGPE